MTETWRPLGVDTEEAIAEYDALHDGVPMWMRDPYWGWVGSNITRRRTYSDGSGAYTALDPDLIEAMCQELKIPMASVAGRYRVTDQIGGNELDRVLSTLKKHHSPLQIADYILAHNLRADAERLNAILTRSKSAWSVGTRHDELGLVRRVPLGVQEAADSVMARAGQAGVRLAKAWEELYGLTPNPSEAYRLAIQAVEDAAIPVVSPKNTRASLGTVLADMANQGWQLPMHREHQEAPTNDVLAGMMRMLWHGQHDRHGGQPSAPGNVSVEEAKVAVSIAVTLVDWFDAGLPRRTSQSSK